MYIYSSYFKCFEIHTIDYCTVTAVPLTQLCSALDDITCPVIACLQIVLQHLVAHVPHRVQKDVLKRLASLPAFAATAKLLATGLKISRDSKLEIDWATMASSLPDLTTAIAAGHTQPGNLNVVFNAIRWDCFWGNT